MSKANTRYHKRKRRGIIRASQTRKTLAAPPRPDKKAFSLNEEAAEKFLKKFLDKNPGVEYYNPAHDATQEYIYSLVTKGKLDYYYTKKEPGVESTIERFFNKLCREWGVYQTA